MPFRAVDNLSDDLTVILLAAGNLLMDIDEKSSSFPFLREIEEKALRIAFGVQMLAKQIAPTLREIAPAATPTTCATKTVIEGDVTRSAAGALQIEGSVDQDDARLGMTWPNSPIHAETTISSEMHLSCYEGARVRITVERL